MNLKLDTQTSSTPAAITSSIVFIDTAVTDYETLIAGVKPGNQVFILDPNTDGVEQITQALQGWEYNSVHIVSHGSQASLQLGSTRLNAANLDTYTTQLQQWRESLSTNAEILLYGCQVASGEQGIEFVRQLHLLTGANIAASQNLTGNAALGGDWQLQASIGVTQPQLAFSAAAMTSYAGVLNVVNNTWENAIALTLDVPVDGTTVGAANDYQLSGVTFTGIGQISDAAVGNDVVYSFTAPTAGTYSFQVRGFNSSHNPVLYAVSSLDATTPGTPLSLSSVVAGANRAANGELIHGLSLTAGQSIYLVVDQTAVTAGITFQIEATRATLETEPNNTPATANTYVFGIEGAINTVGDVDFFSLGTPPAGSRVFAFIDAVGANESDLDLRITTDTDTLQYDDGSGTNLFSGGVGSFPDWTPSIAGRPLTGVPSYIRVNRFDSTNSEPYRLYAVVQPELASATVETEGNDTIVGANSAANNYFSGALSSSTDVDIYSFTANAGDLIFLSADFDPLRNNTPINGALALLDSSGNSLIVVNDTNSGSSTTTSGAGNLASVNPKSPSEGLVYRVRTTSTYYARVTGNAAGDYLLSVKVVNAPELANSISNQTLTTGTAFNFQIPGNTFSDPGDTLTYIATLNNGDPLPSWLSFNAATGTFTGTPRNSNVGNITIRVTAIDSTNLNVNTTFDLSITFSENIINGSASNNTFIATDARDVFNGGDGYDNIITSFANLQQNDSFNGGDGRDAILIQGGANSDTITFDLSNPNNQLASIPGTTITNIETFDLRTFAGTTTFTGGSGNDAVNGGAGNDNLNGGAGDDNLNGGAGDDTLNGGDGNDILTGGSGTNTLTGGAGNDRYYIDNASDVITEDINGGQDEVFATVSYTLAVNVEALTLRGTAVNGTGNASNNNIRGNNEDNLLEGLDGNDNLTGNAGNDGLFGDNGNDTLNGGAGNDLLVGGAGSDRLFGGAGADIFGFGTGNAFSSVAFGIDTISDFAVGVDAIELDKASFTALTSVVGDGFSVGSEFASVSNDTLVATSNALIVYSLGSGRLFYNQNGSAAGLGSGAHCATLSGAPALSASDFVIFESGNQPQT
ncbi:DUF4347 domain-containing protein [Nostoc parmelioides]|uniref:DUF4347 domain-containing protein n=1 Tax=Nostoc parmelioides FACHB-3921 TaxID=2692909 RepID=A0ABR8B865_9NOSO|nr:DUF4347 domain-containing protein [Nostoc parmelioides]MBD2250303.1 DUF4347 domain-containing protein [Nostoc parmelioides FACHB-3921]